MSVRIFTDSTSDLSQQQARQLGVEVIPLTVRFGEEEFVDGVTMTPAEFYNKLEESQQLPQTAQINPDVFEKVFGAAREQGDTLVGIFLSSDLSGTFQSARVAQQMLGGEGVVLVDSRTVTFGLGLLVREAAAMRDAGKSAQEIGAALEELRHKVRLYAAVDTLKYLRLGGRLSGAAAALGGLLNIKPLISVQEGKVESVAKVRGLGPALDWIVSRIEAEGLDPEHMVMFGHTAAPELCGKFAQKVLEKLPVAQYDWAEIGSTVGTHAGPGAVGAAFIKKG